VDQFEGDLKIEYDTGEAMYARLHGDSVDVAVYLNQSDLELVPTYTTLSATSIFSLFNKSDVKVTFAWKRFASVEDDAIFSTNEPTDVSSLSGVTVREAQKIRKEQEENKLALNDPIFKITPQKGEVSFL
jgi:hypothetical protein